MVDRLERNGYVRREVDASDRRRLIIQPLPECLASIAPHCQGMATAWKDLLAACDDEQLALFLDLLTACIGCPSTSSQTLATTQIRHGNRQQMTVAGRPGGARANDVLSRVTAPQSPSNRTLLTNRARSSQGGPLAARGRRTTGVDQHDRRAP